MVAGRALLLNCLSCRYLVSSRRDSKLGVSARGAARAPSLRLPVAQHMPAERQAGPPKPHGKRTTRDTRPPSSASRLSLTRLYRRSRHGEGSCRHSQSGLGWPGNCVGRGVAAGGGTPPRRRRHVRRSRRRRGAPLRRLQLRRPCTGGGGGMRRAVLERLPGAYVVQTRGL